MRTSLELRLKALWRSLRVVRGTTALGENIREAEETIAAMRVEREAAERLARAIHQQVKRGKRTEDHGLLGNLACILDHVTSEPPPFV